jgi:hypothetical protein
MKIGRNAICPCGSGKKYKKCCGFEIAKELPPFEFTQTTGTLWDEYMHLFKITGLYGQGQRQFSPYKKELDGTYKDFERRFRPGHPDGIRDSVFMSWFYLDYRYGKDQKTIIERLLEEDQTKAFAGVGSVFLGHLKDSYCTMYAMVGKEEKFLIFEDIITSQQYKVIRINEPYEEDARKGEIWYTRFVGTNKEAIAMTTPYVFEPSARESFRAIIENQIRTFKRDVDISGMSEEEIHRQTCKVAVGFWSAYMTAPWQNVPETSNIANAPQLANTDNEPLRFCEVFFTMANAVAVQAALSGFADFEHDESQNMWRWFKKSKNKMMGDVVALGRVYIKENHLIGEANSLPRALRLKKLLMQRLGKYISYEEIEAKDVAAMPQASPQELAAFEKEQKEINSDPLVQAEIHRRTKEYYFKSWVRQKIPALSGLTPYQAAKTAQGKKLLVDLFQNMEMMDKVNSNLGKPPMDWGELKKHLGI